MKMSPLEQQQLLSDIKLRGNQLSGLIQRYSCRSVFSNP